MQLSPAYRAVAAAVLALVTAIVGILVGFDVLNATRAGILVAQAGIAIPALALVAYAIFHHADSTPPVPVSIADPLLDDPAHQPTPVVTGVTPPGPVAAHSHLNDPPAPAPLAPVTTS